MTAHPPRRRRLGPGMVVAAAFIGPGSIMTASKAGSQHGHALLWAILFSVIATIVLQQMAARLGLVTRAGLGEALRSTFSNRWLRTGSILLVVSAIAFGNAAYERGNINGASIGIESLTDIPRWICALIVSLLAFLLLGFGAHKIIERCLTGLVAIMGLMFLVTACIVKPSLADILQGLAVPSLPGNSQMLVIALIGTTVVPYNLFLHASFVQSRWPATAPLAESLRESRWDTTLSIAFGGLITMAIAVTASSISPEQELKLKDIAQQLEPVAGQTASLCAAIGLAAAGLTSAITAPLAAAYAVAGAIGFEPKLKSTKFRAVWILILTIGTALAVKDHNPTTAIILAQAANGLLLPIVAVFLIVVVNRSGLMGGHRNSFMMNTLAALVVATVTGLGLNNLIKAVDKITQSAGL